MLELKGCPVCWGKAFICVGIKENLEPILEPCPGCNRTGWLAYDSIPKHTQTGADCEHCLHYYKNRDKVYCCQCSKEWGDNSHRYIPPMSCPSITTTYPSATTWSQYNIHADPCAHKHS